MSKDSAIGWTEHSWNPVTGCTKVSRGCDNCYAEAVANRFRGKSFPNGFDLTLHPERLQQPMKWRKPARIFVNSMSDLFHRDIPDDFLVEIWAVMSKASWHEFQVLTKRPHRMAKKIADLGLPLMPHIWLGVSAEDQTMYDSRIVPLVETTAGRCVAFISAEPLLGPIDLRLYQNPLDWVIVGGESGTKRRPMDYDWARDIRDQCADAGVPFFYKQGNALYPGRDRLLDFRTHDRYPLDLEFTSSSGQRELT